MDQRVDDSDPISDRWSEQDGLVTSPQSSDKHGDPHRTNGVHRPVSTGSYDESEGVVVTSGGRAGLLWLRHLIGAKLQQVTKAEVEETAAQIRASGEIEKYLGTDVKSKSTEPVKDK